MANKKYPYYDVAEPKDLKELVDFCAKEYGDKKAFWYREKNTEIVKSFKQFASDVEALGTYLLSLGYKNTHFALMGENSYEWIVSYFAVVNAGNVIVPIDKENVAKDVNFQLTQSDTKVFLHSDTYSDIAEFCEIESINFKSYDELIAKGKELLANGDTSFRDTVIDAERMCAIVFTSGTTSDPKGVMLNHKGLATDAIISSKNLYVPEGTVSLLPLYHTFGFMACVLCQMLRGWPVFINTSLKRAFDDIKYAQPKHISVVPMLLIVIYNKIWSNVRAGGKEKLFKTMIKVSNALLKVGIDIRRKAFKQVFDAFGGNLEMLITGGSSIDEKYIKGFRDIGITVINGYGITECSPIVSTTRNEHFAPKSVGAIHPTLEARIVDGEVQIKGPTVFMGYYKNDSATQATFDGEWFKTGDLGSLDEDGLLYIDGRKKNLIILSNGKNVVPEELEAILMNNADEIKEVLVYGQDDRIVAEIYPDTEIEGVEKIINSKVSEINQKLPVFKRIAKVKFTDEEFPKTTTKKIKRTYSKK